MDRGARVSERDTERERESEGKWEREREGRGGGGGEGGGGVSSPKLAVEYIGPDRRHQVRPNDK